MSRKVDLKALVSHILRGDGSDRCRICMGDTTDGQVYLDDTVMIDGDKNVSLAELLETVTGIEMQSSKALPNATCSDCIAQVKAIVPFLLLCKKSAQMWHTIAEGLTTLVATEHNSVFLTIAHDGTVKDCFKHPQIRIKSKKDALKVFKHRLTWKKNYKKRYERENRMKITNNTYMICPECNKRFYNLSVYNKHLKNLKKKMCSLCHVILDLCSVKEHMQSHSITVYTCKVCAMSFDIKKYFSIHVMKHLRGDFTCTECNDSFSHPTMLHVHLSKHKACICTTCGKKFSNRICFQNHSKTCTNSKSVGALKYICDYCSKTYNRKCSLRLHISNVHVLGWQYQCDKCGKKFLNRVHLEEHNNTHEKVVDRYVCRCGMKYSTRRGYQRHFQSKHIGKSLVKKN